MKNRTLLMATILMLSGAVFGQETPMGDRAAPGDAKTPDVIEGEVTQVDTSQGRIRLRARDGTMHEFQASEETLKQYKAGDPIKAKRRKPPAP